MKALYTMAERYELSAECTAPLHIGSGDGSSGEVLLHPVSGEPFVQATSIAGVFRNYYEQAFGPEETDELFGSSNADAGNGEYAGSRIKFADAFFSEKEPVHLEIRPRLAIDPETGTCSSSEVSGTEVLSGHKFEMEYIGTGNTIEIKFLILADRPYKEHIDSCIQATNDGEMQFGGQKSNGCGYFRVTDVKYHKYDMRKEQDRKDWMAGKPLSKKDQNRGILKKDSLQQKAYRVIVHADTDGELLVKGIAAGGFGAGAPDDVNIRNAKEEYIIPGSSLKGSIRARMEEILAFMDLQSGRSEAGETIKDIFGSGDDGSGKASAGNLRVQDVIIGNTKENDHMPVRTRIKIDKLTGGTIDGALFAQKNASGAMEMHISIENIGEKEKADRTLALLVLALRDLHAQAYQIGSGYSIGKGYIRISDIEIKTRNQADIHMDFVQKSIDDPDEVLRHCMEQLQG